MAGDTKGILRGGWWMIPLRWQLMLWWIQASTLGWIAVMAAGAFWSWIWVQCRFRERRASRLAMPQTLPQRRMSMRPHFLWVVLVGFGVVGCSSTAQIRVQNVSKLDYTDVSVGDRSFGDIPTGETSEYKTVKLSFGSYAIIELAADGHRVTGQTLNMGAKRFTYRIDVVDLDAGHLDIELVRE